VLVSSYLKGQLMRKIQIDAGDPKPTPAHLIYLMGNDWLILFCKEIASD
jgi:hypothetical protein